LLTLRPPKRTNLSDSEGSSAGAMWVSGMSEASAANPDEGAEQCEATEELQLDVRRRRNIGEFPPFASPRMAKQKS